MKKSFFSPLLLFFFVTGFSQEINFQVQGKYSSPVRGLYLKPFSKQKLANARLMSDLIPYFQAHEVSVYLLATGNGKSLIAVGKGDTLNADQRNILNTIEDGTDLVINLQYQYSETSYWTVVKPDREAEFVDGYEQMKEYLKENVFDKMPAVDFKEKSAIVTFLVNETGEISDIQVDLTSGDAIIDKLLLDAINKMPKWKPAENAKGIKVSQEFEFSIGAGRGC